MISVAAAFPRVYRTRTESTEWTKLYLSRARYRYILFHNIYPKCQPYIVWIIERIIGYRMKQIRNEITEKSFGTFIREKREQTGLSVRALALQLDISAVYLSDIENFNRPAPRKIEVFDKLATALHLTEDEQVYLKETAIASRTEDIERYLKDNPRVCTALRIAKELPDAEINKEWELFIRRLEKLNAKQDTTADNN